MTPSDECLHSIAAAAAMVNDFCGKHKTLIGNLTWGKPKSKVVRMLYPEMGSPLSSLVRQALFEGGMPQLMRKSSHKFLAIKCCYWPKIGELINLETSSKKVIAYIRL